MLPRAQSWTMSAANRLSSRRRIISIPGALAYIFADGGRCSCWHRSACRSTRSDFRRCRRSSPTRTPRIPLDAFRKLYTVGPAIAFIIGPLIGGQIAALTSQRAVFVVCPSS